jgi:hypothetical protein
VTNTVVQVQQAIDLPYNYVQVMIQNLGVRRAMTQNYNNLQNETDTFYFFDSLLGSSESLYSVCCVSYPNLFGGSTSNSWPNITFIGSAKGKQLRAAIYMDWSTDNSLYFGFMTGDGNIIAKAPYARNWGQAQARSVYYVQMLKDGYKNPMTITWSFFAKMGATETSMFTMISQNVLIPSISTSHAAYSCAIIFDNNESLNKYFNKISISPNARLFMFDSLTGTMVRHSDNI